jgi:hypothetical protein
VTRCCFLEPLCILLFDVSRAPQRRRVASAAASASIVERESSTGRDSRIYYRILALILWLLKIAGFGVWICSTVVGGRGGVNAGHRGESVKCEPKLASPAFSYTTNPLPFAFHSHDIVGNLSNFVSRDHCFQHFCVVIVGA